METFVLTVMKDNVLDACEVFESQRVALESARYFCEMINIVLSDHPVFDEKMRGWLVADSYGYFVTVVKRLSHFHTYMIDSSYGSFIDSIAGRGFPRRRADYPYLDETANKALWDAQYMFIKDTAFLSPLLDTPKKSYSEKYLDDKKDKDVVLTGVPLDAPQVILTKSSDHSYNLALPGGFSSINQVGLTMKEVKDNPTNVCGIASLSENQKWALVFARTKRRPEQIISINYCGTTSKYDQSIMLKELMGRSALGITMRDQELYEIQSIYNYFMDSNLEDESSSSDEESDYE